MTIEDSAEPIRVLGAVAVTPVAFAADVALSPLYAVIVISMSMPEEPAHGMPLPNRSATQPVAAAQPSH